MSSLLLLPTLLRIVNTSKKIAVLTFDSRICREDLLGISNPRERVRIVIGGAEGGEYWRNEKMHIEKVHKEKMPPPPRPPPELIISDVLACARRVRCEHPEIGAFLLECASFPLASSELRRREKLPVYDLTDLGRMLIASVR
ncbi:hypothetical protein I6F14_23375 [Bradyrhizobium sp. IC3069]|nr:hypothetical protein [Bradyrhizobium sp. IC4059]MCA1520910.1 hypothetical protein [Bradyrhizobium sp. IC3069]